MAGSALTILHYLRPAPRSLQTSVAAHLLPDDAGPDLRDHNLIRWLALRQLLELSAGRPAVLFAAGRAPSFWRDALVEEERRIVRSGHDRPNHAVTTAS
jgi:hypothetical protein